MRASWLVVVLLAAACAGPRSISGPVKPAPVAHLNRVTFVPAMNAEDLKTGLASIKK